MSRSSAGERALRLADDERARVPFALIGVLLLVGSVGVATVQLGGERVDRDARLASDRAESAASTALRDAVRDAGDAAAANPVVEPSNTTYGRLLDDDRPYRSYLELLVALRLREGAAASTQRVGDATARVRLPPIRNRSTVARALNRTTVESAGSGLVEARVEGVRIVTRRGGQDGDAERGGQDGHAGRGGQDGHAGRGSPGEPDGRVVRERRRTLNVTVATPALELHDRTADYERRLNAGLATSGSLDRGLTAALYGLGWSRGWAQYAGLPIEDPLANRHAELATNLAAMDAQRAAFGTSDPAAQEGLAAASARVAAKETVGLPKGGVADAALPEKNAGGGSGGSSGSGPGGTGRTLTVGVNETADRALADVVRSSPDGLSGDHPAARSLADVVRDAASVEGRVAAEKRVQNRTLVRRSAPENRSEWRREPGQAVRNVESVATPNATAGGPRPDVGDDWHSRGHRQRVVRLEERVPVRYVHRETGRVREGSDTYDVVVDVGLAVATRPKPLSTAVERERPTRAGEQYERLAARAERELLDGDVGGGGRDDGRLASAAAADAVAGDVAVGRHDPALVSIAPADLGPATAAAGDSLADLSDRLRAVDVEASATDLATDANPARRLRRRVADRRSAYVDAPRRYDDLERRAAVAARAVYVERTLERLRERSRAQREAQDSVQGSLSDSGALPDVGLDRALSIATGYARPDTAPVDAAEPARDLELSVDGDPAYLERAEIEPADSNAGAYHPLAAKTTTLPSLSADSIAGAVGSRVAGTLFGGEQTTVPLPVAARSLRGANQLPTGATAGHGSGPESGSGSGSGTESGLADSRSSLRASVADGVDALESRSAAAVAERTALDRSRAEVVVRTATARWESPAVRALAFENGSAASAIANRTAAQLAVPEHERAAVRAVVADEVAAGLAAEETHVQSAAVERVASEARDVTERVVANATERGIDAAKSKLADRYGDRAKERVGDRLGRKVDPDLSKVPTVGFRGVPLAPVPGYWVATANAWRVDVRGAYASFAVSAPRGGPAGGGTVRYVRDGSAASVDVDGDGTREHLGSAPRVSFAAETTVVVVVGPNGGVGNADPSFAETSPGWDVWENRSDGRPPSAYRGGLPAPSGVGSR